MTAQQFLEIAEKLVGKDMFEIAEALTNTYYEGRLKGMEVVSAILAEQREAK